MTLAEHRSNWESWARSADRTYVDWESFYPGWPEILSDVEAVLKADPTSAQQDLVIFFLGRDHEDERILDLLTSHPVGGEPIAARAASNPDYQARWQAGVALGAIGSLTALAVLSTLLTDPHEYVRRRSLLAARDSLPVLAEQIALSWLGSDNEYSRAVALETLSIVGSPHLSSAIQQLRSDPSAVVQKRVSDLEQ